MNADIATEKLKRLEELAPFATFLSRRFLRDVGFPRADELYRIAHAVIVSANYSDAGEDLNRAFNELPPSDKSALMNLLSETSLLAESGEFPDAIIELDGAITYHWPKDFGFETSEGARLQIGGEDSDKLDAFAHAKAEAFWERDAILEALKIEPLCSEDMRIAAAYGITAGDGNILNAVALFADNETLREMLSNGALKLSAGAAIQLQDGLNRRRNEIHANAKPVLTLRWLT